jgi:hypothetical protein
VLKRLAEFVRFECELRDVRDRHLQVGRLPAAPEPRGDQYVPDIGAAMAEVHRVLVPGGWVLIVDTDWDSVV